MKTPRIWTLTSNQTLFVGTVAGGVLWDALGKWGHWCMTLAQLTLSNSGYMTIYDDITCHCWFKRYNETDHWDKGNFRQLGNWLLTWLHPNVFGARKKRLGKLRAWSNQCAIIIIIWCYNNVGRLAISQCAIINSNWSIARSSQLYRIIANYSIHEADFVCRTPGKSM